MKLESIDPVVYTNIVYYTLDICYINYSFNFTLTPIAFNCKSNSPFTDSVLGSILSKSSITGHTVRFITFLSRNPFSIRYSNVLLAPFRT